MEIVAPEAFLQGRQFATILIVEGYQKLFALRQLGQRRAFKKLGHPKYGVVDCAKIQRATH